MLNLGDRPVNPERVTARWRRARRAAGLDERWRLYDLRHWSARYAVASGHDLRAVAEGTSVEPGDDVDDLEADIAAEEEGTPGYRERLERLLPVSRLSTALSQERERLGLSAEEVAKRSGLRLDQVEAIDDNDVDVPVEEHGLLRRRRRPPAPGSTSSRRAPEQLHGSRRRKAGVARGIGRGRPDEGTRTRLHPWAARRLAGRISNLHRCTTVSRRSSRAGSEAQWWPCP